MVRHAVVIGSLIAIGPTAWATAQTPAQAPAVAPPPVAVPVVSKSVQHLERGTELLAQVPDDPGGKKAMERIAELKKSFNEMVSVYTGPSEIVPHGDTPKATLNTKDRDKGPKNWKDLFSEVERNVTRIIGAGSGLGTATGGSDAVAGAVVEPGPISIVGTGTVAKVETIGIPDLDPAVVRLVEQFRTELELFYTEALTEGTRLITSSSTPVTF
jgi:hypothetical protein